MKEVENKPWAEIKRALEEITGTNLGTGLHVRYARMKANFVVFEKGDVSSSFQGSGVNGS